MDIPMRIAYLLLHLWMCFPSYEGYTTIPIVANKWLRTPTMNTAQANMHGRMRVQDGAAEYVRAEMSHVYQLSLPPKASLAFPYN